MSRPFAKNVAANRTFAKLNSSLEAGDFIKSQNLKHTFTLCKPICCYSNKHLNSQSNYLLFRQANHIKLYPCNLINNTELYINLFTKLDLSGNIPVISDLSNNTYPVEINYYDKPYLVYNIDPRGVLFGNTVCGINNWKNFIRLNTNYLTTKLLCSNRELQHNEYNIS